MLRNSKWGRWTVVAVAIGLFCSAVAEAKKPPKPPSDARYTLVDLTGLPRTPEGGFDNVTFGLSEADGTGHVWVVGRSIVWLDWHPVFWSVNGDGSYMITDLGLPPGAMDAEASDVNDLGVITINTTRTGEPVHPAWVLVPDMPLQQLPMLGGVWVAANAVNNLGRIVGSIDGAGALWVLDAEGVPGDPISLGDFIPRDINDLGTMAGVLNGQPAIAWFDDNGVLQTQQLSLATGFNSGKAEAISKLGTWVAGTMDGETHHDDRAFVWSALTGTVNLGTFIEGWYDSSALDVNEAGQVVGKSYDRKGSQQEVPIPVLWENFQILNLNELLDTRLIPHGTTLRGATGINETGHIVGTLRRKRPVSERHGFLLIPNTQ